MANVLLINPPTAAYLENSTKAYRSLVSIPPIGLLSLASNLIAHNHNVRIIDMLPKDMTKQEFMEIFTSCQWHVVGITSTTECYYSAIEIAKKIKLYSPFTFVVMGGPHVTFIDKEPIESGVIDYVIRGEGDISFPYLVDVIERDKEGEIKTVPGCTYRINGNIQSNRRTSFIQDLNKLPFPAYHLINKDDYLYPNVIVSGRGCPGRCIFCAVRGIFGSRYRFKSAEKTVSEFERLYNTYGYPVISFIDDSFTALSERLLKICELLKNKKLDVNWSCESRVDKLSKILIHEMADAGSIYLQIGLESGVQEILNGISKGVTIKQIKDVIKWATEENIEVKCSFMVGHYNDTPKTVKQTLNFVKYLYEKYNIEVAPSINTPFPGTYQYLQHEKLGIKILTKDWSQYRAENCIIDTQYLHHEEIQSFYYDALKLVKNRRLRKKNSWKSSKI